MPRYLELDVRLDHITPPIWRRLLVREGATFADLHALIQGAFGWEDRHLWEFIGPDGPIATRPRKALLRLSDATPHADAVPLRDWFDTDGASCRYTYDFGDGWEHTIRRVAVVVRPEVFLCRVTGGERACPPEDCGGLPGYARCVAVATGEIEDPELRERLGGWDPERPPERADVFERAEAPPAAQPALEGPEAVITAIFDDPPQSLDALDARLRPLHRASARKALAVLVTERVLHSPLHGLAAAAFGCLGGPGRQLGRLQRALQSAPPGCRPLIVKLLTEYDPDSLDGVEIDPETQETILQDTFLQILVSAFWDGGEQIALMLQEAGPHRDALISGLAVTRRQYRIPAIVPYLSAVDEEDLEDLQPRLLSAILRDENGLVTRLLGELDVDEDAIIAADELEFIEPSIEPLSEPRAIVSSCDGLGAFNLLVELADGELPLVVGVCIRAAEGLRDGLVSTEPGDFAVIQEHMTENADLLWSEVTLGEAAGLVSEALEHHEVILELLDETIAAAATIMHLDAPDKLLAPRPRPGVQTRAACAALLKRPEHRCWFLSPEDLRAHGVPMPGASGWRAAARERLAEPGLAARYIGMLRHSARFYSLLDEHTLALLCASTAADIGVRGLVMTPFFEALLDHTAAREADGGDIEADEFGEIMDNVLSLLFRFTEDD